MLPIQLPHNRTSLTSWLMTVLLPAIILLANPIHQPVPSVAAAQDTPGAARQITQAQVDPFCPPLPPPSGTTVNVSSEQQLWNAVNSASPGMTILIADGAYNLAAQGYYLWIDTPGVTLRSASGDRENVILDDNYQGSETITIAASDVTIADLTVNARPDAPHPRCIDRRWQYAQYADLQRAYHRPRAAGDQG